MVSLRCDRDREYRSVVENDHKKCDREARQIKKGMNLKKVVKKKRKGYIILK